MRAIKFRARRKDGALIGYLRFEAGRWQCQMLKSAGGSEEWSSGVLHGAIIEQFTGLKDADGREIHEADVIRKPHPDPDFVLVGEVYWEPDCAGWAVRYSDNRPNYKRGWQSDAEWARWEVIGDTYDNPALISPEGAK
jgi:YopX protein